MAARSIEEQTGWKRPIPTMICQNHEILARVTEYSFNLNNPAFRDYCEARGVLWKAGVRRRFRFTADHSATKDQFFVQFRLAEKQPNIPQYVYSDDEMEFHWRLMLAAKGALQDAWELFTAEEVV